MRAWYGLVLLASLQPACALAADAPYYGPMQAWHGIGYKFGFEDRIEKDGSVRIDASTRRGDAVDMAMYRAAEIAREQGFAYVQFLGGSIQRGPGVNSATLYVRPVGQPQPPAACRSRRDRCYTADVTELMRRLSGPDGNQPGVATVDHIDQYGRAVTVSGFGLATASLTPPVRPPAPAPVRLGTAAMPQGLASAASSRQEAADRFEQARKAVQPVRGRDPKQGWTISD